MLIRIFLKVEGHDKSAAASGESNYVNASPPSTPASVKSSNSSTSKQVFGEPNNLDPYSKCFY